MRFTNGVHHRTNDTLLNGTLNGTDSAYKISENPLGEPRPICVITIGASALGLNLARQIDTHIKNVDYVIYKKNSEVGGT